MEVVSKAHGLRRVRLTPKLLSDKKYDDPLPKALEGNPNHHREVSQTEYLPAFDRWIPRRYGP
jgi:hypothetical protein